MDHTHQFLLCFDSSTPAGSVALVQAGEVIAEHVLNVKKRSHSDYLMRFVDELLEGVGLELSAVTALVVVVGPGSFTGLRVGLATVQGIAQALSLPIYPVSSLHTVAYANGPSDLPVVAMIDARKQEVYSAKYLWMNDVPERQGCEQVIAPAALLSTVTQRSFFVGNGATLYRDYIRETVPEFSLLSTAVNNIPRASAAGLLVLALGERVSPVEAKALQPCYVRLSDAELQQQKG